jgi:hypothetical protein
LSFHLREELEFRLKFLDLYVEALFFSDLLEADLGDSLLTLDVDFIKLSNWVVWALPVIDHSKSSQLLLSLSLDISFVRFGAIFKFKPILARHWDHLLLAKLSLSKHPVELV